MQQKFFNAIGLVVMAGTMSACNSTESPYRYGPWNANYARSADPGYGGPWGRPPVSTRYVIADPTSASIDTIEVDVMQTKRRREVILETDIGPAPVIDGFRAVAPVEPPALVATLTPAMEANSPVVGQDLAAAQPSPPGVFSAPRRASSYAGSWNARVGGSSCKVQLSSTPSLDLYKASTQGCSHEAMRSVNGWSLRENQVILFSRGQLVARLSGAEAALTGTLNSSGSEVTMSR